MHPTGWIKRRARSLMRFFRVSRAEAVQSAREDWLWRQGGNHAA